jgi:putative zinc finger protein
MTSAWKCRHVEPLLALAAGGDLSPAQSSRVERHLRSCAGCREAAEAFATTMHTVRELPALELSPEEAAQLRRGVWKRIERERAGLAIRGNRTAWTAAGWAAVALVVLALVLPWRGVRDDRSARTAVLPPPPPPRAAGAPPAAAPAPPLAPAPAMVRPPRIAGRRTQRRAPPILESQATQPVRIELSTPDPDVRIVWLVGPPGEALPALPDDFATATDTTSPWPSTIKESPE